MPGIKELKTRIKSVQGTRKITRAMQMVSAAKMRKAQSAVLASRTYSDSAWDLVMDIVNSKPQISNQSHSKTEIEADTNAEASTEGSILDLLRSHSTGKKIGVVVLGTNRGFVGSLNSNLGSKILSLGKNTEVISEVVVYGKKAKNLMRNLKQSIVADFEKSEKTLNAEDIYPLAKYIVDMYTTGEYRSIVLVYNHFVSTLTQKPNIKQLLPFISTEPKQTENTPEATEHEENHSEYIFEPSPIKVLEHLLPRIVESQIYQAILESNASEHSARMVMMKNATEAAGDLINDYTLTYNQLRQSKITTELAEITAGKIALE
jgi:F-type H+-transporting ATPase subunit gamma